MSTGLMGEGDLLWLSGLMGRWKQPSEPAQGTLSITAPQHHPTACNGSTGPSHPAQGLKLSSGVEKRHFCGDPESEWW